MRKDMIQVYNRTEAQMGDFGLDTNGPEWTLTICLHASVTWAKGNRALNAGSIDVYGVKTVRLLYTTDINPRSRIVFDDVTYQILPETFHADRQENQVQFQMQAIIND